MLRFDLGTATLTGFVPGGEYGFPRLLRVSLEHMSLPYSRQDSANGASPPLPEEFHTHLDLPRVVGLRSAHRGLEDGSEVGVGRVVVELQRVNEKRVHYIEAFQPELHVVVLRDARHLVQ